MALTCILISFLAGFPPVNRIIRACQQSFLLLNLISHSLFHLISIKILQGKQQVAHFLISDEVEKERPSEARESLGKQVAQSLFFSSGFFLATPSYFSPQLLKVQGYG